MLENVSIKQMFCQPGAELAFFFARLFLSVSLFVFTAVLLFTFVTRACGVVCCLFMGLVL